MYLKSKIVSVGLTGASFLLPILTHAQGGVGGLPTPLVPVNDDVDVVGFINLLFNYALGFLIIIAGIMVLYAAFLYVKGDEKDVETANKMLRYAAIAVIIGILSKGLIAVVARVASQA